MLWTKKILATFSVLTESVQKEKSRRFGVSSLLLKIFKWGQYFRHLPFSGYAKLYMCLTGSEWTVYLAHQVEEAKIMKVGQEVEQK